MAQELTTEDGVVDALRLRKALGTFVSGVTIVTTEVDGEVHGMTANAFTSVSLDPPLVLVSIAAAAKMDDRIKQSGRYGVSILCKQQEDLSLHFAGARLKQPIAPEFQWRKGVPLVKGALVHFACTVTDSHPAGDHTLHVGHVDALYHEHGDPLVFFTGSFKSLNFQGETTWEF
ncbi:MAG: flavin reductase [Solirubrobacterales bacterium]|nr:flavin reductase [Solirubrobacterales bacterium]